MPKKKKDIPHATVSHPELRVGQVFLLSAVFAHRGDVLELGPKTDVGQLDIGVMLRVAVDDKEAKGIVFLTVHTKEEQNPIYQFRVEMAALIERTGESEATPSVHDYLMNSGAVMLYPFIRETVANITTRGRFGPVYLRPFNFAGMSKQLAEAVAKEKPQEQIPG